MEEVKIRPDDEFIKLGQLLKKCGIAQTGTEAKFILEDEDILVNGELEKRRGRKIYEGDVVSGEGFSFKVVK